MKISPASVLPYTWDGMPASMNAPDVFIGPVLTAKAFCAIVAATYADELLQNDMDTIINLDNK